VSAVDDAVAALLKARSERRPIPTVELSDDASAYAVQAGVASALGWFGEAVPRYWKSGGPSLDAPQTHAPLPPDGVFDSPADLSQWPFQFRGIEAEIALRLGEAVDARRAAELDVDGVRSLLDAMCVSIELVDSRWSEARQAPQLAKLADLQSHGALVLGTWVPFQARDWSKQRCEVRIGQSAPQVHTGTHSFGDPVAVLPRWLRHATRDGAVLPAGTVVTTGTWCGLPIAAAGDLVEARFEGIGEARVQL
jgi:2-keto-4-pentenoate hydratase